MTQPLQSLIIPVKVIKLLLKDIKRAKSKGSDIVIITGTEEGIFSAEVFKREDLEKEMIENNECEVINICLNQTKTNQKSVD
jgi:hypothetical protein